MPRRAPGELSEHPTKGYRITCGWYMKDGRKTPKVFWLGKDKDRAILEAAKIRWAAPIAAAMGGWTKDYERSIRNTDTIALVQQQFQTAERMRQQLTPNLPAEVVVNQTASSSASSDPPFTPSTAMLHAALDAYVEAVQQQPLSDAYKDGIRDSVEAIKSYRRDCPLSDVTYAWLESFTSHLKSRPRSRNKSRASGRREPIKPYTVARLLQHARQAFKWIHKHRQSQRFGGWTAPADWEELFSVELGQLMTKAERDRAADGPEQLTLDEIKKLYHAACQSANKLHRILFLMGLFTAQGQSELACTRRDEFDLDKAVFVHRRNKTGQKGVYWLPPELVTMLREHFQAQRATPDELAFRTREGQPLVTARSDAVRQAWEDWRQRAGISRPGLGFYSLRRFFGDWATRQGGDALGDTALAHTAKTVRGKHYSNFRDFEKIQQVGQGLHTELKTRGLFQANTAMPKQGQDSTVPVNTGE